MSTEILAVATNPSATLSELYDAAHFYPDEVLANPGFALQSLEDPAKYIRVFLVIRQRFEYKKHALALDVVPLKDWRRVMVRLTEQLFADVPHYQPREDLGVSPALSLEIAKRYLKGDCSRQTLSWGARFAQTFIAWIDPKKATEKETLHTEITRTLAQACKACCAVDRQSIWRGICDVVLLLSPGQHRETIEQYDAREKILDELLSCKKKQKKGVLNG